MKTIVICTAIVLVMSSALAQQQPAQSVQDQLVTVYVNLNSNLAKQLDVANAQIADLTKKLADETAKCEPKKPDVPAQKK